MTAEERIWFIDRYKEEEEKRQKAEQKAYGKSQTPIARPPNVRRPK